MKGDQAEELMKQMRGGKVIQEQRVGPKTPGLGESLDTGENGMLGSNKVLLTASLLAKLSLGVSSDWESAAQATGLRRGKSSSAAFFSVRCLVTSSCRNTGRRLMTKSASPPVRLHRSFKSGLFITRCCHNYTSASC